MHIATVMQLIERPATLKHTRRRFGRGESRNHSSKSSSPVPKTNSAQTQLTAWSCNKTVGRFAKFDLTSSGSDRQAQRRRLGSSIGARAPTIRQSPPSPTMPQSRAKLQRMNALLRANLKMERKKNVDVEKVLASYIVKQETTFKGLLSGLSGSVKAAVYKMKVKKGIVKEAHTQSRPVQGLSKLTKLSATTPPIAAPPPPIVDPNSDPPQRDAFNGSMIDALRGRSSSSK